MGTIILNGMKFYAFHGHYDTEQIVGNQFVVDIKIKTDCSKAAQTDQLDDALDYQLVYEIIQNEMEIKSRLLENVAHRILNAIYSKFTGIEKTVLKISKMNPAMGGEIEKVSLKFKR